eukprot:4988449-Amphidinium_carterae.1
MEGTVISSPVACLEPRIGVRRCGVFQDRVATMSPFPRPRAQRKRCKRKKLLKPSVSKPLRKIRFSWNNENKT